MPSRPHSNTIKKSRFKTVLKERGITYKPLCEAVNCNPSSLSRALKNGYMEHELYRNIAEYLDVSVAFLDGRYKLRKLRPGKTNTRPYPLGLSGIDIPPYWFSLFNPSLGTDNKLLELPENQIIMKALLSMGKKGIKIKKNENDSCIVKFNDWFIIDNSKEILQAFRECTSDIFTTLYKKHKDEDSFFEDCIELCENIENPLEQEDLEDSDDIWEYLEEK